MAVNWGAFNQGITQGANIGIALHQNRRADDQNRRSEEEHQRRLEAQELDDMLTQEKVTAYKDERVRQQARRSLTLANTTREAIKMRRDQGLEVDPEMINAYNDQIMQFLNTSYGEHLNSGGVKRTLAGLMPTERGTAIPVVQEETEEGHRQRLFDAEGGFDGDTKVPLELTPDQIDEQILKLDSLLELSNNMAPVLRSPEAQERYEETQFKHGLRKEELQTQHEYKTQQQDKATEERLELFEKTGSETGRRAGGAGGGLTAKARDFNFLIEQGYSVTEASARAYGTRGAQEIGKVARSIVDNSKDAITGKPTVTMRQAYTQATELYESAEGQPDNIKLGVRVEAEPDAPPGVPSPMPGPTPGVTAPGLGVDRPEAGTPASPRPQEYTPSPPRFKGVIQRMPDNTPPATPGTPSVPVAPGSSIDLLNPSAPRATPTTAPVAPAAKAAAGKVLTMADIRARARKLGVPVAEYRKRAEAKGYTIR
jgi:hypothetical protein